MDIPSLFMIPSAVSSGKVHSVFPNSTDADFDFNRDSDATRVNSEGLIERVGYYGSELVTNGGFDTDSNWTKGTGWSIANGKATLTNGTDPTYQIFQGISGLNTKNLKVSFDITNFSGDAEIRYPLRENITGNGSYVFYGVGTFDRVQFQAKSGSTTSFNVDNVSVVEVTGDRARLNYEIEGGLVNTKPSLLLEPQRTNSITYSNDFTQSTWSGTQGLSVTANNAISPEGIANATKAEIDGSNVNAALASNGNITVGQTYTLSMFVKNIDFEGYVRLTHFSSSQTGAWFNLNNGTIGTVNSTNATIEKFGNGWYRLTNTFVAIQSVNSLLAFLGFSDTDAGLQVTSTGQSLLVYGMQLELGSYATSYIPTNGSTQTRAEETCNGAGTSSILPSEEGILYAEIAALADDGTFRMLSVSDGTNDNRVRINYSATNGQIQTRLVTGGVTQADISKFAATTTDFNKVAIQYKANEVKLYVNGVQSGSTDTSASVPSAGTFDQVNFYGGLASNYFYGKVRDIRVYNTKEMTDSEVDILLTKITS